MTSHIRHLVVIIFLVAALFLAISASVPESAIFNSTFIFEPRPDLPMNHASSIAQMPDQSVMVAWYAGSEEAAKDVKVYASRLDQASGNWTEPKVIADTPDRSEGNPVLFADQQGKVWLFYVTIHGFGWTMAKIKYQTSDDQGRTFGPVTVLRDERGWMTRAHPLTLSNSEILLPLYDELHMRSVFMSSMDQGKSWNTMGEIVTKPGNLQPSVVELGGGTLLSMMRCRGKNGHIWKANSQDKGRTWSSAEQTSLPNPDAGIDLVRLQNGHLVLALNNSGVKRTPLSVAISEDNGKTWPFIRDLETAEGEFSYPSLVQTGDGLIHISYTYKRVTIKHAEFNEEWVKGK